MCREYRLALSTALALVLALPTMAQDQPGPKDPIEQLQGKNVLTDEDQATLRAWVTQRVQTIAAGGDATQAVKEWRESWKGTDNFKEAFAAASIEAVGAAYKQAKRDSAARLIALLNTLNQVSAHPLLVEALGDERVPVRTAAVIGLRNLQAKLAGAGGTAFADCTAALREAGKRETSPVTLQLIYRAIDYTALSSPPDPKVSAAALLELLVARGQQYGARSVKAEGADRPGLELAAKLANQLDEQGRQRLIIASARMLHYAVTRYTSDLHKVDDKTSSPLRIELRDRIELFIEAAETLLSKLTSPPDDAGFKTITSEMQDREAGEKNTYMKIAMNHWADVLQERFQFDVHMDVAEDAGESAAGKAP
jgi:hypothetical protein